jgi:capsular exopolysaccharide synthesis family protein
LPGGAVKLPRRAARLSRRLAAPATGLGKRVWERLRGEDMSVIQTVEGEVDRRIVAYHLPSAPVVESYRRLRANLFARPGLKAVLFTSAEVGEGKTMSVVNFAACICGDLHRDVLLVDTDMRHPTSHRLLGAENEPGLADLLEEKCPIEQVIRETPVPQLHLLPAGRMPWNSAKLLGSARMRSLIPILKQRYAYVVFDAPAVLPVADAVVLAPYVDGVVLVVQAFQTRKKASLDALKHLERANVLGFLMNQVEESPFSGRNRAAFRPA